MKRFNPNPIDKDDVETVRGMITGLLENGHYESAIKGSMAIMRALDQGEPTLLEVINANYNEVLARIGVPTRENTRELLARCPHDVIDRPLSRQWMLTTITALMLWRGCRHGDQRHASAAARSAVRRSRATHQPTGLGLTSRPNGYVRQGRAQAGP